MKTTGKILALVIALCVALSVSAFAAAPTWADYQAYLVEAAGGNAPDLAEFQAQVAAIASWDQMPLDESPWDQLFSTLGISTWDEFVAAGGVGALSAETGSMAGDDASGEASSDEPSGEASSDEPSGEPSGEASSDEPSGEASGEAGENTVTFSTVNPFAGEITVIVTYTGDAASGITLVSVVDPDLGEDILPVQSEDVVAGLIAQVIEIAG